MNNFFRNGLLALQFFTRIPLPSALANALDFTPQRMRTSLVHLPAIGWLVGAVAALVFFATVLLWGVPMMLQNPALRVLLLLLAAIISTAATLWLTGAMHEDGLADVADALLGHHDSQKALRIMKDSNVGVYAVLTLLLVVAGKISLITAVALVQFEVVLIALPAAHVLSRMWALTVAQQLAHVGLEGQSKTQQLAGNISKLPLWQAVLWCVPLLGVYWLHQGLMLLAMIVVGAVVMGGVTVLMGWWFQRRLGGFTGDCLGATQQVCELAFYASTLTMLIHISSY